MHLIFFILLFIFFFVFLIILFILRAVGYVFRPRGSTSGNASQKKSGTIFRRQKESKKVFDENEGEYVDYEEIKEDK